MSKISVIVPVYNVEDYLDECIQSILNQTHKDLELILVDDGSKDGSGSICEKYAGKDSRVIAIHKENGGVSSARNLGLERATGDFVAFVDADDYLESTMYETLLRMCETHGADICLSTSFFHNRETQFPEIKTELIHDAASRLLAMRIFGQEGVPCSVCGGVYKRALYNGIWFQNDIHHYEDYLIQTIIMNKTNNVVTTTEPFYHYRVREGSANTSNISYKTLTCMLIADRLQALGVKMTQQQYNNVKSYFIGQCYFKMILSEKTDSKIKRNVKTAIWKNGSVIIKSDSISATDKVMMLTYPLIPFLNSKIFGSLLRRHLVNAGV